MFDLLKRLAPREPLPAHVHFHLDDHGNRVFCDEAACRPSPRPLALSVPPRW
jgi:hypothetical protein